MSILKKIIKSFFYAFNGWQAAFVNQLNFRVQCVLGATTIMAGFYFQITPAEWLWLTLNIALVLAAELFNSAIETLVDLVSPGYDAKAGRVKDIAAGAVTVLVLNAVITAAVIFIPKLW